MKVLYYQKALLITKKVELIKKKEFAPAALDPNYEVFVVYIAACNKIVT